jgi:glycerol-3-phosphate O-acyltransferase / dihydroxyacetone phosphate acyltransferase
MYFLLKLIARIALRVFFRKIHLSGREYIPKNIPLIIAANHPNTFMDPMLVAVYVRQDVYFLANGSIFKNPIIAWFLRRLHLIPIYRKKDVGDGQKPDNTATFAKCFQFLQRKGTLLIFPEGTSEHERRLRPLKTGTARIALSAEAENNFKLGVRILPIGLTYTDPKRFRSEVFLHFSKPIDVCEYTETYRENPVLAVDQLTDELQKRLTESTIVTTDEEQDLFVNSIEQLYKTRLSDELELSENPAVGNHLITQGIIQGVKHFETHQPERLAQVKIRIQRYTNWLERLGLDEETIRRENTFFHRIGRSLLLIFGFPLYLYGLILNYLPYILPSKLALLISRDVTYRAPLMMTTGLFTFTGFYVLETYYFHQWLTPHWLTILFAISLPVSGFFAWYWWLLAEDAYESRSFRKLSKKREGLIKTLLTERTEILQILEQAKTEYLAPDKREV